MPDFCFHLISVKNGQIFTQFYIFIFIDKIYVYDLFVTELWLLIHGRISLPLSIFRTNGHSLTKLYKCIYIDKICVKRIFTCFLVQISNKVMALDWQQNFVSAQYLMTLDRISPNFVNVYIFIRYMLGGCYLPYFVFL